MEAFLNCCNATILAGNMEFIRVIYIKPATWSLNYK